jgi:hypothetical protein
MTFTNSTNFLRFVSNFFCFLDKRKCFFSSLNIHSAIFLLNLKAFFGFTTKWMFCNFMLHENDRMLINCGPKKKQKLLKNGWRTLQYLDSVISACISGWNTIMSFARKCPSWTISSRVTDREKLRNMNIFFQLEVFKVYEWEKTLRVFKIWKEQDFFISFVSFDSISLPLRHFDIQKHAR